MNKNDKIYVAGHTGMLGSAIVRLLNKLGYKNLILKTSDELNLISLDETDLMFNHERPDVVIFTAALVGGIQDNIKRPAHYLYDNLRMQNNVIDSSYFYAVMEFCFIGSCCIYPRDCPQPMKEEYLLTGPLEPTNEGYAIAKIAGIKMIESYHKQYEFNGFSVIPPNLYGTNDYFNPDRSHVLSSLIKKIVDALDDKRDKVEIWGDGTVRREFMHVDDCARAIIFLMENYDSCDMINIGWGVDTTISYLAEIIKEQVGWSGDFKYRLDMPTGMPQKCLDVSRIDKMGFNPEINLENGINKTIKEYRKIKREHK